MNIHLLTLGNSIWQVGEGILALATLVLLLALCSPEVGRRMTTPGAYCLLVCVVGSYSLPVKKSDEIYYITLQKKLSHMIQWENLSFQRSFPSTPQDTHGWFDHCGY